MKLRQLLESGVITQALNLPEPEVGDDYASEKVKRYIEIITKALDAMKKKDNNDANDAIVGDLRDKKKKWSNVDKETAAPKVKQEEPPEEEQPEGEEEPPPEEEEPSPEEEDADKEEEEADKEEEEARKKEAEERKKEAKAKQREQRVKEALETPFERYMTEAKPPALGSVWNVGAKCYNKKNKLIGVCLDTPNAIAKAMMNHKEIAYAKTLLGKKTRKDYKSRMEDWNTVEDTFQKPPKGAK